MQKIAKFIAALPVRFYRAAISPLFGPTCRFHPTCSAYALEAIEKHGAVKGGILAVFRVCRCHPLTRSGFTDPVPEAFAWGRLLRYKRAHKQES
jgi:putative membrane protein insertion efficiency factor